jgi:hypothetical protein
MASEKAWYWLAAGVLALGLNGAYQDGKFQWAHRLADQSAMLVEHVRDQGCRFVAMAEIMLGHDSSGLARAQDRLARLQDRLSTQQVDRMQRQMEAAQLKVERAQERMVILQQDEPCSHSHRFMVQVPEVNVPAVNVPAVNVRAFVPNITVPAVNVPSVQIPEINVPQVSIPRIVIPAVRIPAVKVPPVHVQVNEDDDDGMI